MAPVDREHVPTQFRRNLRQENVLYAGLPALKLTLPDATPQPAAAALTESKTFNKMKSCAAWCEAVKTWLSFHDVVGTGQQSIARPLRTIKGICGYTLQTLYGIDEAAVYGQVPANNQLGQ